MIKYKNVPMEFDVQAFCIVVRLKENGVGIVIPTPPKKIEEEKNEQPQNCYN